LASFSYHSKSVQPKENGLNEVFGNVVKNSVGMLSIPWFWVSYL